MKLSGTWLSYGSDRVYVLLFFEKSLCVALCGSYKTDLREDVNVPLVQYLFSGTSL